MQMTENVHTNDVEQIYSENIESYGTWLENFKKKCKISNGNNVLLFI